MYNANWQRGQDPSDDWFPSHTKQFRATLTILLGISSNPQGNISLIMIYGCLRSNGWREITRYVMFYNKQWHFAGIVLICANKSLIWRPPCSKPSMKCNAIIYPFSNAFCASALRCRRHCVFRVIRPSQRFLSVTLRKHRSNSHNFCRMVHPDDDAILTWRNRSNSGFPFLRYILRNMHTTSFAFVLFCLDQ